MQDLCLISGGHARVVAQELDDTGVEFRKRLDFREVEMHSFDAFRQEYARQTPGNIVDAFLSFSSQISILL